MLANTETLEEMLIIMGHVVLFLYTLSSKDCKKNTESPVQCWYDISFSGHLLSIKENLCQQNFSFAFHSISDKHDMPKSK